MTYHMLFCLSDLKPVSLLFTFIMQHLAPSWFETWFNTPYYHQLYSNRDKNEAASFIDKLLAYLQPKANSLFLDMPCGSGRHAQHIAKSGYFVTGIDLASKSIELADKSFTSDHLEFFVHDMRRLFRTNYYHYVLNLFTSLGYFDYLHENELVIHTAASALKPGGKLIIDFMNSEKALSNLVPFEIIRRNGIDFEIKKYVEKGFILKEIKFNADNEAHVYYEKLYPLTMENFLAFFKGQNLKLLDTFGSYDLQEFDLPSSDRLILIAEKIS